MLLLGGLKGRGKASGAPVDQLYAAIFNFRGDRTCRFRAYFDRAEALKAVGLEQ